MGARDDGETKPLWRPPLVPQYMTPSAPTHAAGLMPRETTTARPDLVDQVERRPYRPPLVVVVAWGRDATHAAAALCLGLGRARQRVRVKAYLASHTARISDGVLYQVAQASCLAYEMGDGAAWWHVPHSAVNPRDWDQAHAALRQLWAHELAFAEAFEAKYGFPLADTATGDEVAALSIDGSHYRGGSEG